MIKGIKFDFRKVSLPNYDKQFFHQTIYSYSYYLFFLFLESCLTPLSWKPVQSLVISYCFSKFLLVNPFSTLKCLELIAEYLIHERLKVRKLGPNMDQIP